MVKVLGLGDNVCDIYLNERTMYPGGHPRASWTLS